MKAEAINSNCSTNFRANIKFANVHLKSSMVVDNCERQYANKLLDKLKAYHPEDTITIGTKVDKLNRSLIYAINSRTGCEVTEEASLGKYDGLPGCNSFYKLLNKILAPEHCDFWSESRAVSAETLDIPTGLSNEPPIKHSIFIG